MRTRSLWVIGAILLAWGTLASGQLIEKGTDAEVTRWVKELGSDVPLDRAAAEVGLSLMTPDSFPLIEAALNKPGLPPVTVARLKEFIAREKPRVEARLRTIQEDKATLEWNLSTALTSYDKVGKKGPWDDAARKGIKLFVTPYVLRVGQPRREPLEQAIKAGCDDPLVLYMEAESVAVANTEDAGKVEQLFRMAAVAMEKSDYPAFRKLYAANRYVAFKMKLVNAAKQITPEDSQFLSHMVHFAIDQWELMITTEKVSPAMVVESAQDILQNLKGQDFIRQEPLFGGMLDLLTKNITDKTLPLAFKGQFYVQYAWEGRSTRPAAQVTEEGWKLFRTRLATAQESLESAWQLDPRNAKVCIQMMKVELGQGLGAKRERLWFERAMAADPDSFGTCAAMMLYLQPKWHGSAKEMVQFGRECRSSKNWYASIPDELVLAHIELGNMAPNPEAYFATPEVWQDLQSVYLPHLKARPRETVTRSSYAFYACRAGHWAEARKQFDILGADAVANQFGGEDALNRFKERAMGEKP